VAFEPPPTGQELEESHMRGRRSRWASLAVGSLLVCAKPALAQESATPVRTAPALAVLGEPLVTSAQFRPPADLEFRAARITSAGVRLHAELFSLRSLSGRPLPTVVMGHGWGGTAAHFRRDAVDIARAGYLVLCFDYRGWGESEGRVILTRPSPVTPEPGRNQRFTAEVVEQREYVDPLEQASDWFSVIGWAAAEPAVDKERIGIRGSSYSGGHVVHVAAFDPRVKAVVSQVGYFDSRPGSEAARQATYSATAGRSHGEPYPPPRAVVVGRLAGAPILESFMRYAPVEDAAQVRDAAVLFVVAEKEELFDNEAQGRRAYERMPSAKKKYVTIPGISHFGVYREAREQAVKYAIDWFDEHLKGRAASAGRERR